MKVIIGTVIRQDNKLLMVQEAKEKCYGQWNFPAGHLDENENIFEGAKRETKEETGYDVKLKSILCIQNYLNVQGEQLIRINFNAEILSGNIEFDKDEILDVKWISINELKQMDGDKIRSIESIKDIIHRVEKGKDYPLDIINNII